MSAGASLLTISSARSSIRSMSAVAHLHFFHSVPHTQQNSALQMHLDFLVRAQLDLPEYLRDMVATTSKLDDAVTSFTSLPTQAHRQFSSLTHRRIIWTVAALMILVRADRTSLRSTSQAVCLLPALVDIIWYDKPRTFDIAAVDTMRSRKLNRSHLVNCEIIGIQMPGYEGQWYGLLAAFGGNSPSSLVERMNRLRTQSAQYWWLP